MYLKRLQDYIDKDDNKNVANFVKQCESLQQECLANLKSDEEKIIVGSGIVVAKYSAQYWNLNLDNWIKYYSAMPCSPNNQINDKGLQNSGKRVKLKNEANKKNRKLRPHEKQVLQDDCKGAIGGAIASAGGGPLCFAGALIGGAGASCISAITIGFGIRHITDWFW